LHLAERRQLEQTELDKQQHSNRSHWQNLQDGAFCPLGEDSKSFQETQIGFSDALQDAHQHRLVTYWLLCLYDGRHAPRLHKRVDPTRLGGQQA